MELTYSVKICHIGNLKIIGVSYRNRLCIGFSLFSTLKEAALFINAFREDGLTPVRDPDALDFVLDNLSPVNKYYSLLENHKIYSNRKTAKIPF